MLMGFEIFYLFFYIPAKGLGSERESAQTQRQPTHVENEPMREKKAHMSG